MSSFEKRSVTADAAQVAITGAIAKARQMGHAMSIVVVDEAGLVKASVRMDGASEMTLEIATDKARTAASFGRPTHAVWDYVKSDPPLLAGFVRYPGVAAFGGGYPIVEQGRPVGGIGVSGSHYSDDMEVARAGLSAIGAPIG